MIPLGNADADIEYMPDEPVVVFDPAIAQAYRPRHASDSAWGDPIESA